MKRAFRGLIGALALFACSGTETGNPPGKCERDPTFSGCPVAILLVVTDAASGGPISDVTIDGRAASCRVEATSTTCGLTEGYTRPGHYTLRVSAAGYVTTEVGVDIALPTAESPCCRCGYEMSRVELALEPQR